MYDNLVNKWFKNGEETTIVARKWQVARDLEELNTADREENLASWYARGMEQSLLWFGQWSNRTPETITDLWTLVQADRAEMEACKAEDTGYNGWHQSEIDIIEKWQQVSPVQMWEMITRYKSGMRNLLEDRLDEMLRNNRMSISGKDAERIWRDVVEEWEQSFDEA